MSRTAFLVGVLALTVVATVATAGDQTISTNTVWSGTVTVDGTVTVNSNANLTIQPGTIVNFVGTGNINFVSGGLFSAQGTAAAPIQFNGTQTGGMTGNPSGVVMNNCAFAGLGVRTGSTKWFYLRPSSASSGFSMTNCTVNNVGPMMTYGAGTVTATGNNIQNIGELDLWTSTASQVNLLNNKIQTCGYIYTNSTAGAQVSHNVIIDGQLWVNGGSNATAANYVVEDNYIHGTYNGPASESLLVHTLATIRNNVIRGGEWGLNDVGGKISNNVMECFTAAERALRGNDPTHEPFTLPKDGAVVERNILLNSGYAGIITAGSNLGTNCVFRNNTLDQRGGTAPMMEFNHLPSGKGSNINIRNNLFLRGGRFYDESNWTSGGYADTISYVDYNAWGGMAVDSRNPTSQRFIGIQMTGKNEGDDGFGMHDILLPGGSTVNTASLVANADFVDPYSDADMLAGTHTTAQLLSLYQQAYTPVAGSALINAGSPTDASDPAVTYGQVDIGAVELSLLPGDTDMDRKVTFADYIVLERNFGATNATWAMGDFNGDGKVTFADYIILEGGFGKSVPEPMTLSLLAIGAVALLRRRR